MWAEFLEDKELPGKELTSASVKWSNPGLHRFPLPHLTEQLTRGDLLVLLSFSPLTGQKRMIHTSSGDRILSPQSQSVSKSRRELDFLTPQPGSLQTEAMRTGAVLCGHHREERRTGAWKGRPGSQRLHGDPKGAATTGGCGKQSAEERRPPGKADLSRSGMDAEWGDGADDITAGRQDRPSCEQPGRAELEGLISTWSGGRAIGGGSKPSGHPTRVSHRLRSDLYPLAPSSSWRLKHPLTEARASALVPQDGSISGDCPPTTAFSLVPLLNSTS